MADAPDKTLFSKIIDREIPADVVYEDEDYLAFNDISPEAPTHVLVVPKKPIPSLKDAAPEDAALIGGLFVVAQRLMAERGHADYRTVFNCGAGAGQTVFHLHLHVLAGRPFAWPPG